MIEIIRPINNNNKELLYNKKYENIIYDLFNISFKQLLLKDIESSVKKAALNAVASCLCYFADILSNKLDNTLSILFSKLQNVTRQTTLECFSKLAKSPLKINLNKISNQLLKEQLNFLKHKVDDGLPLRKASFQCLDTLLDNTSHKMDLFEYIRYLRNGINDESHDIQMLTYQILTRLPTFHGSNIVGALDTLPNDLMKGIKGKMNEAKGNKDPERAKDILGYIMIYYSSDENENNEVINNNNNNNNLDMDNHKNINKKYNNNNNSDEYIYNTHFCLCFVLLFFSFFFL